MLPDTEFSNPCRSRGGNRTMHFEMRPIDHRFAFEVRGIPVWTCLDEATIRELDDAWSMRGVMVFPRQPISEAELLRMNSLYRISRKDRPDGLDVVGATGDHANHEFAQCPRRHNRRAWLG